MDWELNLLVILAYTLHYPPAHFMKICPPYSFSVCRILLQNNLFRFVALNLGNLGYSRIKRAIGWDMRQFKFR